MKKRFEIEYRTNGLITQELCLKEIRYKLEKRGIKITELPEQESEFCECGRSENYTYTDEGVERCCWKDCNKPIKPKKKLKKLILIHSHAGANTVKIEEIINEIIDVINKEV